MKEPLEIGNSLTERLVLDPGRSNRPKCFFHQVERRLKFAAFAFGEDALKQRPDVGLGAKELTTLARMAHLVNNPPSHQLAEVHAHVPSRDPKVFSERLGGPIRPLDVEKREKLPHRRVDPPRARHRTPMLDELAHQGILGLGNPRPRMQLGDRFNFLGIDPIGQWTLPLFENHDG